MNHIHVTIKRLSLYVVGLFFLSLGVSFSILANFGVSPVSSLAYAFSLTTGLSVGMMTIVANLLFIILQIMISKRFNPREAIVQLMIAFLFGFFMDLTLYLLQLLPVSETPAVRVLFLIVSLFVVAVGLLDYTSVKLPLMPYDELTAVIATRFKWAFSKAKITSDLLNVVLAGLVCLTFIRTLGSIGIGTVVAAVFIGKILGWLIIHFREPMLGWVYRGHEDLQVTTIAAQAEQAVLEEKEKAERERLEALKHSASGQVKDEDWSV
ncbi:YitT family protein [Bhargavaea ullalensis]|uniref:Membrane protein YczE n=1 Tax=Bhargavaea ullalensis TaxID=1265685 RepID=A0ABV2GCU7_9BACL